LSGFGTSHCYRSTDSGDTWQDAGEGLPDVPTNAVIVDPEYPNNVYVGNDLGVYFSSDSGKTWQFFSEGLNEAAIAMDFSISPTNRMLRVATHGNGAFQRKLLGIPVGIKNEESVPYSFELRQNYPNPFNPQTTIEFRLTKASQVTITVFNELGQKVGILIDKKAMTAGVHKIDWKPERLASGTYFYKLQVGSNSKTRKMIYAK